MDPLQSKRNYQPGIAKGATGIALLQMSANCMWVQDKARQVFENLTDNCITRNVNDARPMFDKMKKKMITWNTTVKA